VFTAVAVLLLNVVVEQFTLLACIWELLVTDMGQKIRCADRGIHVFPEFLQSNLLLLSLKLDL
jgi:hypothetical protein